MLNLNGFFCRQDKLQQDAPPDIGAVKSKLLKKCGNLSYPTLQINAVVLYFYIYFSPTIIQKEFLSWM